MSTFEESMRGSGWEPTQDARSFDSYPGSQGFFRRQPVRVPPVAVTIGMIDLGLLIETATWTALRSVRWLHAEQAQQLARINNLLDQRLILMKERV